MVKYIYDKVFTVLGEKPFKLWGMSLLGSLLAGLACVLCGVVPLAALAISAVIGLGMSMIFLAGYRGQDFNSEDLFVGFKDFWRCAGGMLWMTLWIFIWGMIPVVGPVFAIIKAYSYRFTPYILATNKDITAMQALKLSMAKTEGFKGKMFGADMGIIGIIFGVSLVLTLLGLIPYVGIVFKIIYFIVYIVMCVVSPLIFGLISAAFFDETEQGFNPQKYMNYQYEKQMIKQQQMQAKMAAQQAQMLQYQQQQAQMAAMQQAQMAAQQQAQMAAMQQAQPVQQTPPPAAAPKAPKKK